MSKHIGRKNTWVEVSRTRFNGFYGYVQWNKYGKWEAILVFQTRQPLKGGLRRGQPKSQTPDREWKRTTRWLGEFKRSREAMMSVEKAAKNMKDAANPDQLI